MHRYSTTTYETMPVAPHEKFFRDTVPRLARRSPYLMHQLLTMTALHTAHLQPNARSRYLLAASHHQSHALSGLRNALSGPITEDNSDALFTTSAFLTASTFASYCLGDSSAKPPDPIDGYLNITSVLRGLDAIQDLSVKQFQKRPSDSFTNSVPPVNSLDEEVRFNVLAQLARFGVYVAEHEQLADPIRHIVGDALTTMMRSLKTETPSQVAAKHLVWVVCGWPMVVDLAFLGLVYERNPVALTTLLYYCVILQRAELNCWYLQGWSARLAQSISRQLQQHAPWSAAAQWSLEQLGRGKQAPESRGCTTCQRRL